MAMEDRKDDARRDFAKAHANVTQKAPGLTDDQKRYKADRPHDPKGPFGEKIRQASKKMVRSQKESAASRKSEKERLEKERKNKVEYGPLHQRFNQRSIGR